MSFLAMQKSNINRYKISQTWIFWIWKFPSFSFQTSCPYQKFLFWSMKCEKEKQERQKGKRNQIFCQQFNVWLTQYNLLKLWSQTIPTFSRKNDCTDNALLFYTCWSCISNKSKEYFTIDIFQLYWDTARIWMHRQGFGYGAYKKNI